MSGKVPWLCRRCFAIGLDDLEGFFQPDKFYDSMILCFVKIVCAMSWVKRKKKKRKEKHCFI